MPTTQVKMNQAAQQEYDPLASVSIMDQLRSATSGSAAPRKLWVIGDLPVTKQFQTLGVLMVMFLVFAALMMFLDSRQSGQSAAASATATEMQMLSQRLARGSALAAQGQATAFAAVKDSRDRFKADLDALVNGGTVRGVSLDVTQDDGRDQAAEPSQGELGTRGRRRGSPARQRDEPDHAGQGSRDAEFRQQRAAGTGAAGRAADRPKRRDACAKSTTRTSSPCCRSASRRTPIHWRRPTKSTRRSRSCWARTPARSATS